MYKLVSLDLDGTLFNSHSKISTRNAHALALCHEHHIETVIATGRPPRFTFGHIPEVLEEYYLVCYNGAHVYYNRELILEKAIKNQTVRDIISYVHERDGSIRVALESKDIIYCNFEMSKVWPNIAYKPLDELHDYDHICKLLLINHEAVDFDDLKKKFGQDCYIISTDQGRLIEIMDKRVSKFNAIKWIAARENIAIESVIAFGDDHNDLEILSGVGLGVAMANGVDCLKTIASEVTLTNDQDGVAIVLERIIKENV